MKLLNSGRDKVPNKHLLSSNQALNAGIGLHLIKLLDKGIQWICGY